MDSDDYDSLVAEIRATENKLWILREKADQKGAAVSRMGNHASRISIGVTLEEFNEINALARRCDTSVSALGQLALKHLLTQARLGTIPMLPVTLTMKHEMGKEDAFAKEMAQIEEQIRASDAKINILEAQIELDRLAALAVSKK